MTSFSFHFAERHKSFIDDQREAIALVYAGQLNTVALTEAQRLGVQINEFIQLPDDQFAKSLTAYYQSSSDSSAEQMAEDMGEDSDLMSLIDAMPDAEELMAADDDAPVIRLINAILNQAINVKASDVHVETFEDKLVVRFRVDGVLSEVLSPKRVLAPLLVSRLKVMAKLDIAEKRVPQDGRISVKVAGHAIDLRVSTLPSTFGERVVLRILDKQSSHLSLQQLAMPEQVFKCFKELLAKPHGIVLVTGPTGSGKTTTLYAGLSHINQPGRNIMTIEDPVEYVLPGIGQTQVNQKVGMSFAAGLRAILRQDPDVVMVGEIRDKETAEIAVQASLTGHLVLSTLHTNSAVGAINRLVDMGLEPFLLASSMIGVMAQRLVRLNCSACSEEYEATDSEKIWLQIDTKESITLRRGVGCGHCNHSGFKGRKAVYELVPMDEELRRLVHDQASQQEVAAYAASIASPIHQSGIDSVIAGETTVAEIARVVDEVS